MKTSKDRILTTHVGSLIRPDALQDIMRAKQGHQEFDQAAYEKCLKESVAEVVHKQAEIGVDVVSDGEFGKAVSWNQYVIERLSGFELRPIPADYRPGTPGSDRTRFKDFYTELDVREPRANPDLVACVGPVKYVGQEIVKRDIENFKAALKGTKVEEAFMPVVAPSSVLPDRKEEYYKSEEEWLTAITDAMRVEYKMIVDAGFILQIDDARFATAYDRMVPPGTFEDYRRWLAKFVESLNAALEGIPEDRVRYHVCWGSWPGPHVSDVPLRDVVDMILKVKAGAYVIEFGQSAARTRMVGVEGRQAAAGPCADPRRHQPRHQRGRASRTDRRADGALRQPARSRKHHDRHRLRLRPGHVLSPGASQHHVGEVRGVGRGGAPRHQAVVELTRFATAFDGLKHSHAEDRGALPSPLWGGVGGGVFEFLECNKTPPRPLRFAQQATLPTRGRVSAAPIAQ